MRVGEIVSDDDDGKIFNPRCIAFPFSLSLSHSLYFFSSFCPFATLKDLMLHERRADVRERKNERIQQLSLFSLLKLYSLSFAIFYPSLSLSLILSRERKLTSSAKARIIVSERERERERKVRSFPKKKIFSFCAITKTSVARVAVVCATCVRG